jgi:enoyl-CoA hydratase/carnithine racemase
MAEDLILVERTDRVAVLTLNRPEARNALNTALLAQLTTALERESAAADVGAIVLTGAGPAFCAGADLKESATAMEGADFWAQHDRATRSLNIHQMMPKLPVPVIAAVNGAAVAGGCGLAMSCDIVFASGTARFGYPEVGHGLVAAMAMVSLSRCVGRHQALDLLLSGRLLDADEALRIGLVNRVVAPDELMPVVLSYAGAMAAKPAPALRLTKALYRQVSEVDYDRALEYARDVNMLVRYVDDARAGSKAYARKREELRRGQQA